MSYMLAAARPGTRAGETRSLGDWPPLRPSGPEPGSADGPAWPSPLAGFMGTGTGKLILFAGLGFAAWWFLLRKQGARHDVGRHLHSGRGRRRRRRRSRR